MKKYIIILILLIVFASILYFTNNRTNDFSKKYDVDENHVFKKVSARKVTEILENETAIIYLGYPTCPWCQKIVPILNETVIEYGIENVYYIDDFYEMRPDKNDNPKHKEEYKKIAEFLGGEIVEKDENTSLDIIRVPIILFIKNGKLIDYHIDTYEGHELKQKKDENGKIVYYLEDISENKKQEIKNILNKKIREIYPNKCDRGC